MCLFLFIISKLKGKHNKYIFIKINLIQAFFTFAVTKKNQLLYVVLELKKERRTWTYFCL